MPAIISHDGSQGRIFDQSDRGAARAACTRKKEEGSHNDVVDEDACLFLVASADEEAATDIFGNIDGCPSNVSSSVAANRGTENAVEIENLPILPDRFVDAPRNANSNQNNFRTPPPSSTTSLNDEGISIPKG